VREPGRLSLLVLAAPSHRRRCASCFASEVVQQRRDVRSNVSAALPGTNGGCAPAIRDLQRHRGRARRSRGALEATPNPVCAHGATLAEWHAQAGMRIRPGPCGGPGAHWAALPRRQLACQRAAGRPRARGRSAKQTGLLQQPEAARCPGAATADGDACRRDQSTGSESARWAPGRAGSARPGPGSWSEPGDKAIPGPALRLAVPAAPGRPGRPNSAASGHSEAQ
jgi:hypothetical protein